MRLFAPAWQTLGAVLFIAGVVVLLGWNAETPTTHSNAVASSVPWLVWRVVGAITALVFVVLVLRGMRMLLDHRGAEPRHQRKPGPTRKRGRWRFRLLVGLAAVVLVLSGGLALLASRAAGEGRLVLPVRGLDVRTVVLLGVGMLAAVPWLSLAWLVHAECRMIRTWTGLHTSDAHHAAVLRLGRLWKRIVSCVTAFAVAVIAVMATTGVMRAVFLDAFPDRKSEFPAGYVLLYGFPFLMAVLIISVPLITAWRSAATHVLDHAVPIPGDLAVA